MSAGADSGSPDRPPPAPVASLSVRVSVPGADATESTWRWLTATSVWETTGRGVSTSGIWGPNPYSVGATDELVDAGDESATPMSCLKVFMAAAASSTTAIASTGTT